MKKKLSIHRRLDLDIVASQPRAKRRQIKPTPEEPLIISVSELRDFLRCRVKWLWRHHHRIVPAARPAPLAFGGLVHELLAAWYRLDARQRTIKTMRRITRDALAMTNPDELKVEDVELATAMCVGYAAWAKKRDRRDGVGERTVTERYFRYPIVPDKSVIISGVIDAHFRSAKMKRTVGALEHKTAQSIKIDSIDLNLQLSTYLWTLRHIYPKAKRYIAYYNVLRKQMPGPRVKADLFGRESLEATQEQIDQWEIDTRRVIEDIVRGPAIYPNPMDSCSWSCDYVTPCLMRGSPSDLRHVLENDFVRKESR